MSASLATAMAKIVEILAPLESEQRRRVVQAAFALLGEETATSVPGHAPGAPPAEGNSETIPEVSPAAAPWLARVKITREQLEQHIHFDSGAVRVISLPGGATKRIDQVFHTYLMQGLAAFLATGEASFTDKDARDLCEHFGCYDATNHAKYLKEFGNKITGTKSSGWKLTAPGLAAASELVRA